MFDNIFEIVSKSSTTLYNKSDNIVVLTFNEGYVKQALNLMLSITHYNENISFICLCDTLSLDAKKDILSENNKLGIKIYELKFNRVFNTHRWFAVTVFRLFIPWLVEDEIDKVLYLDCDMICKGDLSRLFNLDNYLLCMAHEVGANAIPTNRRQGIQKKLVDYQQYCNAGMELINVNRFKTEYSFDEIATAFFDNISEFRFLDQDFLNWYFAEKIKTINGIVYNFQPYEYKKSWYYNDALEASKIIHFTSGKPWDRDCELYLLNMYERYSFYQPMIEIVKNEKKRRIELLPIIKLKHVLKNVIK